MISLENPPFCSVAREVLSGFQSFSGLYLSKRAAFVLIVCFNALSPRTLKINHSLSGGKYFSFS